MFISVKTKAGRVAYTAPSGGELIPTDRYMMVDHTPWIDRLLKVHGDIEREPETKAKSTAPVATSDKPNPAPAA